MTAVAPFRLFGRAPEPAPGAPAGERPPESLTAYPGTAWGVAAWPASGPSAWAGPIAAEPPTDPRGLPAVPAPRPAWLPHPAPSPDPAEAAALAGAFAVDYLSWDEEDPARRGRVLHGYLAVPGGDPARIGWNGEGRQRADFALPGRVRADGDGRVLVDVRVRVTPYRAVGGHERRASGPDPAQIGVPAVAPAPTGRGWRSMAARWVRLSVPVVWESGRLAVDAWEETIGEDVPPPQAPPTAGSGGEHTLAEDDPLAEIPGGRR
ncbi:hypothetical protein FHX44_112670 [Pseudonocardia hierapolitana]|uniref:Uncharacterized protein n=1 Tax=Pseudonocardia hierapolitana TaxID=1128676 RepID=A0A561SPI6_9PSEU|nr:hypothetical protein [Pseudonocardia hierapolitana]TWF76775.1 hypothetical protein FHX44_112670 [Pseudonocardia hierapolitana]